MAGQIVASSNRTKTSYVIETTPGVTPATPAWKEIYVVSNGLKLTPTRGRSKDLRPDGQAGGTFLLDLMSSGSIPFELKYKMWDDWFALAVKSDWVRKAYRDNNGTADSIITAVAASSDSYTVQDDTIDFAPGHLVLASGFGQSANNLLFKAQASTNGTSVISPDGRADEAVPPAAAKLQAVGIEGASGDITATSTGLASTSLDFTLFNIQPGEWHVIGGFGAGNKFLTAALNGSARVQSVAAHAIVYDILPTGWTTDDGAGKSIQVFFPDFMKNGTNVRTLSVERQQQDLAAVNYEYFSGEFLNNLSLTITGAKEIDMSAEFIGLGGTPMSTSRFSGSTDVAAATFGTMTASSNIGDLVLGNVSIMGGVNCMVAGSIKIANNISRDPLPGTIGTSAVNVGSLMVSGNIDTYLGSGAVLANAVLDTLTSFSFPVKYGTGNHEGYRIDCPAIKLTPDSDIPGQNTGRKVNGPFEAEPHPVLGYTISICRYWYLPV